METEHTKSKKKIIIISILAVLVVLVFVLMRSRAGSFEANDEEFFYYFANTTDPERCEVYSLDAYYLKDIDGYYYEIKYALRIEGEEEWTDIDKVMFGISGMFNGYFCLNWDERDLADFAEERGRFERAKKEGVHRTYTLQEVNEAILSARKRIAKEEAEYEAEKNK